MHFVRFASGALVLLGIANLVIVGVEFRTQLAAGADTGFAAGEVMKATRHETGTGKRRKIHFDFQVKFATAGGEKVEGTAMKTWPSPRFGPGERVHVAYSKASPRAFNIDDPRMNWADAIMNIGWAVAFIAGGASALRFALRPASRARESGIFLSIAGAFVGGGAIVFCVLQPWPVQVIVAGALAYITLRVVRSRRSGPFYTYGAG